MILQSLASYYDRLAADPEEANAAPFGSSRQKIGFCVVVEPDGELHAFQPVGTMVKNRLVPESLVVPGQSKPSGQGINPCFLWDNAAYMLGFKVNDPKPDRTRASFVAFRDRHLKLESVIDDTGFTAVCSFLKQWEPEDAAEHPELAKYVASFGLFRVQGRNQFVHERPKVIAYWREQLGLPVDERTAQCLVTGRISPIARLHEPKIKGVKKTDGPGAAIVSFNWDAYTSYEKEKGLNAPVSAEAAFKYATALNHLLAQDRRKVVIGDATTVFWSEKPTQIEEWFGPMIESKSAEDHAINDRLNSFLRRLRQGKAATDDLADANVPFYVLGLSPNRSRLSVRFWLVSSVGECFRRLQQHADDLEIACAANTRPPTIRELADETAPPKKGWPDRAKVAPLLAGALVRAVLTGAAYPDGLFAATLRRIRAEGFANRKKRRDWDAAIHRRAAILKASLNRRFRTNRKHQEVPVSLDPNRPDVAYRLGRWFAALEKVQEEAYRRKLNATIKDRFFSSAMATPGAVFPRLIRLHQHHLRSIDNPGRRVNLEKLIQEIADPIEGFPSNLNLQDQGLFAIGYYHQRQHMFLKEDHKPSDGETRQ